MSLSLPIHGRGAAANPPNRFEPIDVVFDEASEVDPAEMPSPKTVFMRDASRSILATNDSPDVMIEASINPYRGCEHGCVYCMDGATPILMADGSTRPLEVVRVGDAIYGTRRQGWYRRYVRTEVLAHWETEQEAFRVTLHDGTQLIAGPNHRFLTERGWKFISPSPAGQRPTLTTSNKLMGIGAFARVHAGCLEADGAYQRGYLCGLIRGDGHLASYQYAPREGRTTDDQHQFRLALVDRCALDRASEFLRRLGVATRPFVFQPEGESRQAMYGIRTSARAGVERVRELIRWDESPQGAWKRGFLAGIYDAEGSYSDGVLRLSNTDEVIIGQIASALRDLGFMFVVEHPRRAAGRPIAVVRVCGGLVEHCRFFHIVDPSIRRKCDIEGAAVKSMAPLRVASVEPLGRRIRMFDITTGTGDFIADGVVSHNCYARPTHEYFGLSAGLDFETKIFVKDRAPELLRAELMKKSYTPKVVSISGVTDCYQPIERKLQITRRCLQVLAEFRNPCGVITKNHLVTRDVDVLRELAEMNLVAVFLSITTLDSELQRRLEPRTSTPGRRLAAIETLAKAGVRVGVMVAPVIPGLTDHEMPAIVKAAADAGAQSAGYVPVRLPFAVKDLFADWLDQYFPERKNKVLNHIRSMRGGKLNTSEFHSRMSGEGPLAEQLSQMFEMSRRRAGLTDSLPPLARDQFRRPAQANEQMGLWG